MNSKIFIFLLLVFYWINVGDYALNQRLTCPTSSFASFCVSNSDSYVVLCEKIVFTSVNTVSGKVL